ncbi:MAG: amidohydrolase family protein [Thalassobaculum sp.]|uniref:amidohydrolase family protein n=1 Tax=Thalassobaculum sp. TaxID=2022740 RepID=UPI0032EDCCAC
MEIVDAQIHVWGTGLPSNAAHWQITSFTAAEAVAMMDEAGVDAAVIHPPSWDPDSTELATEAVATYPGRFAIIGAVDLGRPEASRAAMEGWRDRPGMLGLRCMFLAGEDRRRLHDGELGWFWAAAERLGIPVTTLATGSFGELADAAVRHPGLRLTIDHLGGRGGNTTLKDAAAMEHMPDLLKLARLPNVAVKATGAPGYSSEAYPFPAMHAPLRQIFDAFGPDRMFWGTDISKMPCSWRQCVTLFTEELPWLAGADLARVMGGAVRDWWGWPRPGDGRA